MTEPMQETPTPEELRPKETPFESTMRSKLEELKHVELPDDPEKGPKEVEKLIWGKLREIYQQLPEILTVDLGNPPYSHEQIQLHADYLKTYEFPVQALLNFALKYEQDDKRKKLYELFFQLQITRKENEIKKWIEEQHKPQTLEEFTPDEIKNLQEACIEWEEYLKEQKEQIKTILVDLASSETGYNQALKAIMSLIQKDSKEHKEQMFSNIRRNYPFMRHIDYKEKYDGLSPEEKRAAHTANHVAGTSTINAATGMFIQEIGYKFSPDVSLADVRLYIMLLKPENMHALSTNPAGRKQIYHPPYRDLDTPPDQVLNELKEKLTTLGYLPTE